jgi:tetratricopeptide (TPR) repeat protein
MSGLRRIVNGLLWSLPLSFLCLNGSQANAANTPQVSLSQSSAERSHSSPLESMPSQSLEAQGDMMMLRGNYATAIEMYQHAWPRTASTWNKTGIAYHHLFALDEALKDYQLALTMNPHYAEAYNNMGAVYHGKKEFGSAEKAYKKALKYEPSSAVTYSNLGTAYFAQLKYKKGAKAYRRAIQLDPGVFSPERGNFIEDAGSREQRIAIELNLARVYASAGRNDDALDSLRKALSSGFNDRKLLMEDKELASLRKTPEFHQLLVAEHME